jgi:plasmid stabilization system protein ParE
VKVRFVPRAARDLADIADYIAARNPRAAGNVRDAIIDAVKTVAAFPRIGRRQNVENVRRFVTRKYSYIIYYTVDEAADELAILSIRHSARRREYDDA